jgi:hypothetical protein
MGPLPSAPPPSMQSAQNLSSPAANIKDVPHFHDSSRWRMDDRVGAGIKLKKISTYEYRVSGLMNRNATVAEPEPKVLSKDIAPRFTVREGPSPRFGSSPPPLLGPWQSGMKKLGVGKYDRPIDTFTKGNKWWDLFLWRSFYIDMESHSSFSMPSTINWYLVSLLS